MADEGATPRELILEASRRNNTSLLEDALGTLREDYTSLNLKSKYKTPEDYVAEQLNSARDGIGNGALHLAATNGCYDVLDLLLDQEGLEIDELDRLEKDTPLHKAVRYVNSLGDSQNKIETKKEAWESGHEIVEILIDAGCDPRIRNKAKLKPKDLADPRNDGLRAILTKAEFQMMSGGTGPGGDVIVEDDDDGPTGSASDSD